MKEVASPAVVRDLLSRNKLSCRKSLGQNFLIDSNIINKIIEAADLSAGDLVVEIGPGLGALTARIARSAGKVLAVEVDRGLLPLLAEVVEGAGDVEIIHGNALEIDFDNLVLIKTGGRFGRGSGQYKLVANLPYYITSPLLINILQERYNLSRMVVMVQSEVADRLGAAPGTKDYGVLSVIVQYFTDVKVLFRVPRTVFYPSPAVDSAVVRLILRPPLEPVQDEKTFFKVVRAAFGKRRKTLLNSLTDSGFGIEKEVWRAVLESSAIDPGRRGETLCLAEFARLTGCLREIQGC
ncbi:16S rRNA (adenine(1518)-N(6)/adenine(1519)-N(6))-dimethyltransferase RsmA [Pelotomaculum isophthalicicum JI]|uniref:Ribosomal RNA small subunit methyltransferase A n=1 Tax=Pelotomaculum isophthalicicum JI TaxID=947010 RepID=A0A9X4JVB4_9FIRM|nr:16S rRNA (adenine(1518)-N(6)/adenine(1519)-N(6))-dimethyltransferase RsmA [Pelotomaculum isophthalicicum]MDF9407092.1 16S rRNA (adenine(1518)-N(6)/adenine(1519)-N(6))-dimethyltransferase RsmA [Pelotomaculum isophthalicicum JI]